MVIKMKMERISENKIRITISTKDLTERNISADSLNYNSREARELFWDMMQKAEIEFGFTTADAQLCIEAVPHATDEFIITITKVEEGLDDKFYSIHKYIKSKYKKSELLAKKRSKRPCSPILIYSFQSIQDLKNLSSRILKHYQGKSSLYRASGTYYLILFKSAWMSNFPLVPILQEYGNKISYISFCEGFLNEYGVKISEENALQVIQEFY